jgi:hypothetical protein
MDNIAPSIRAYHYRHFKRLPADKQFHFASRLSSWSDDPQAHVILEQLKPSLVTDSVREDLSNLITTPPSAKINAAERRAPYFARYPELRGLMLALFRVRHLLFHYHIDVRDTFLTITDKAALYELSEKLQSDKEAVSILSTYAINYIYLVEVILFPRKSRQLDQFISDTIALASSYDDTPEDSLLLIYLFTHCIIGASNFYQSTVYDHRYREMLTILEARISNHFHDINLDNKFEFLVCCKLTGFTTSLEQRIQEEALQSVSSEGTFLIDTVNSAGQSDKRSFADSEHRNVLYIMSQLPFVRAEK